MIKITIVFFAAIFANYANAQIIKKEFYHWAVFTTKHNKNNICYIVGDTKKRIGFKDKNYDGYIMITKFPDKMEFSASGGFVFNNEFNNKIIIDNKNEFNLLTKGNLAWIENDDVEKKLLSMLLKANSVQIVGYNHNKQANIDHYSLKGFKESFYYLKKKCN